MKTFWWANLDSKENVKYVIVQCALPYCTADLLIAIANNSHSGSNYRKHFWSYIFPTQFNGLIIGDGKMEEIIKPGQGISTWFLIFLKRTDWAIFKDKGLFDGKCIVIVPF